MTGADRGGSKTHDQPLRGESEIVRGRKSKESLGEESHQVDKLYRHGRAKVKGGGGQP